MLNQQTFRPLARKSKEKKNTALDATNWYIMQSSIDNVLAINGVSGEAKETSAIVVNTYMHPVLQNLI
jgi:hypothetical protein